MEEKVVTIQVTYKDFGDIPVDIDGWAELAYQAFIRFDEMEVVLVKVTDLK